MIASTFSWARRFVTSAFLVVLSCAATVVVFAFVVAWMFAAKPGEWVMPIRLGPPGFSVTMKASVASVLRVATHPLGIAMLDGRSIATHAGVLHFARLDDDALGIDCAPCRIQLPGLGADALQLRAAHVTLTQHLDQVGGTIGAGAVSGHYTGSFDAHGMKLELHFDDAPISTYYQLFGDRIPEARVAAIGGSAAFAIVLELPSARLVVRPKIEGFTVSGLGTEALAGRLPQVVCGGEPAPAMSHARLRRGSTDFGFWLPRAVVAAEDQRYYEHPGYDVDELAASLARNEDASRIERGASTIPQQLARLLYVGSERTPSRKLRELLYAVEMEQTLGKARMLQLYLTVAPWGKGTCGAEAAAKRYFGASAARLSGAQSVWLAAMLHAPDGEAARWNASGGIDLARAGWVANGLRGVRRTARERILDDLSAMAQTETHAFDDRSTSGERMDALDEQLVP